MSQQLNPNAAQYYQQRSGRTFQGTDVFRQIKDAGSRYKNRLNFTFRAHEVLQLLEQQPYNEKLERTLRRQLQNAVDRVDKRPIDDQIKLKNRYQKSHGLVFKGIPLNVQRQVVFHAIEKLGATTKRDDEGEQLFPGECKMRTFMYPKIKDGQRTRNAFPIFVNRKDKLYLYQWAKNQGGMIKLEPEATDECPGFTEEQWDGLVSVELVRGSDGELERNDELPMSYDAVDPSIVGGYGAQTPTLGSTPPRVATPAKMGSEDIARQLAQVMPNLSLAGAAPNVTPPRTMPALNIAGGYMYGQSPVGANFIPYDPRQLALDSISGASTPISQVSDAGYIDQCGNWVNYPLPTTSPIASHQSVGSYSSEHSVPPVQFTQFAQQLLSERSTTMSPMHVQQPIPSVSPVVSQMQMPPIVPTQPIIPPGTTIRLSPIDPQVDNANPVMSTNETKKDPEPVSSDKNKIDSGDAGKEDSPTDDDLD